MKLTPWIVSCSFASAIGAQYEAQIPLIGYDDVTDVTDCHNAVCHCLILPFSLHALAMLS